MNNDKNNLIFISIPKTGTISVRQSLGLNARYNHMPAKKIMNKIGSEKWNSCYSFTFVRNPYDRLVSWYFFHRDTQNIDLYKQYNFKQWLFEGCPNHWTQKTGAETLKPLSLHDYLLDEEDNLMVDFVGRVENINRDFKSLMKEIGVSPRPLKHKNKSKRKRYQDYYDKESRAQVQKLFGKDLELFKYKF